MREEVNDMDVVIFGFGRYFQKKKELLKKYNVVGIIDNNKEQQGKTVTIQDKKVVIKNPEMYAKESQNKKIIIAAEAFIEMSKQLIMLGISYKNIDFAQNYEDYGNERIYFNKNHKIEITESGYIYHCDTRDYYFNDYNGFFEIRKKIETMVYDKIENAKETDLNLLSIDLPKKFSYEIITQNDMYNHSGVIKNFCGLNNKYAIKASIEHACYMGDDYYWEEDINHDMPGVITLSQKREEILRRHTDKNIYNIGIYIAYADYMHSVEDMNCIKQSNGRTLTVFPMHSTAVVNLSYDISCMITKIKEIAKDFDTVKVCMYWKDIIDKKHKIYENEGFDIVSAGNIYDKNFLARLKSILYCSDCVMSNDIGSYIGQAMYMGKPCYLIKQDYNAVSGKKEYHKEYDVRKLDSVYNDLFKVFGDGKFVITEEQKELCDYVWGINHVKSKEELRGILDSLEEEYKRSLR